MKRLLSILAFALLIQPMVFSQDCKKCDTGELLILSENMDHLDYQTVKDFICTFDSTCSRNAEFSEWSNELLFDLVEHDVDLLNQVIHDLGYNYARLVAAELESPVMEEDLNHIYHLVKNSRGAPDIIVAETEAIEKAAKNEGVKLVEISR